MLSAGLAPLQLAAYFAQTTSESHVRVGSGCKDTAAGARLSDLKALSRITGTPVGELGNSLLKCAIPAQPESSSAPVAASTMSVALQAHFEHLATSNVSEFARYAASVASLMGIASLRGQEVLRLSVASGLSILDDDRNTLLHVRCQ